MTKRTTSFGQSLVEVAIVLPLFVFLVLGIVDGARYVFLRSAMSNAAREAARVGIVEMSWVGSQKVGCNSANGPKCLSSVLLVQGEMTAAANRMLPFAKASAVYTSCDPQTGPIPGQISTSTCVSRKPDDVLTVRVTATFNAITPVIGQFLGTQTLDASVSQVIQ